MNQGPQNSPERWQQHLPTAAAMLWAVATDDDHNISRWDGPVYQGCEAAFRHAYVRAYPNDPEAILDRVRDLLSELGPDDHYHTAPRELDFISSYRWGALQEARLVEGDCPICGGTVYTDEPWHENNEKHCPEHDYCAKH